MKSSPAQQDAVAEAWTANFLVFGQALHHWNYNEQKQKWVDIFKLLQK